MKTVKKISTESVLILGTTDNGDYIIVDASKFTAASEVFNKVTIAPKADFEANHQVNVQTEAVL